MKRGMVFGAVAALLCAAMCMLYVRKLQSMEQAQKIEMDISFTDQQTQYDGYDEQYTVSVLTDGTPVEMKLHEYLVGVLLAEMPAAFEPEALKAQAVAARTFALRQIAAGKHDGAVCTESSCCQAWVSKEAYVSGGGTAESIEKMEQAAGQTDGCVAEYNGMLIDAVFFSCSGGRTESAVAVWGGEVPYLQAVDSPGEEDASAYVDTLRVSTEEFCRTLEALSDEIDLSGAPDTWVGETTLTDGGGVDTIEIGGVALEGTRLRSAFGLRSTKFELSVDETEACFTTFGFGHRVGMSQYGANAMAKNGASYDEILRYYYQGIDIVTLSQ